MTISFKTRPATIEDVPAITAILNHYVVTSKWLHRSEELSVEDREAWLADLQGKAYPVIVAVSSEGKVVGYAAAVPFRTFPGAMGTAECSVYLDPEWTGRGLGRRLSIAVEEALWATGRHAVVAGIDTENERSMGMYKSLGYAHVGMFPHLGTKFGEWRDIIFLQKMNPSD